MTDILGKSELIAQKCNDPTCTSCDKELFFSSECHVGEPMHVCFDKKKGVLHFICGVCAAPICGVWIGEKPAEAIH